MKPIAQYQRSRQQLSDIILIAILLGAGIGLLTTAVSEFLKSKIAVTATLGVILVLTGLWLTSRGQSQKKNDVLRLRGAIAFRVDDDKIKPIHIYGYGFNDDFCKNLIGFLAENAAYKKRFLAHFTTKERQLHRRDTPSYEFFKEIIISVVEFILLDKLDLHLNKYFVENEIDTSVIKEVERKDLPLSVLSNKVIDTLTRHYSEREAFVDSDFDENIGEVFYATGKGGAVYNRLSVELPPNSSIDRSENGSLRIKNANFELSILVKFEGYATHVHPDLLQGAGDDHFSPYMVQVNMSAKASPPLFRSNETDKLYEWLDSYIESVQKFVSIRSLEDRLNPEFRRFMFAKNFVRESEIKGDGPD
jgi:hypothetical protein